MDDVVSRFGPEALGRRTLIGLLLAGWAVIGVGVGLRLNQGWVPHDDGSFAQSAQRVLDGQLPHRDFAELYTGGMTFLNAAVFRVFGENLIWLRVPVFVLFLASIPCLYSIARRFVSPLAAALVTVAAYAWGFPAYPAAMPTWYVLFFAVGGCAALLRYLDTGRYRWLFVAGLLGGLAIAVKVVGIYYVLAALLFLTVVDQESSPRGRRRLHAFDLLLCAAVPFSLFVVVVVMRKRFGAEELVNLVVPVLAVSVAVLAGERLTRPATDRLVRLRDRARPMLPFLAGVCVPILLVAAPYVVTGSLDDLVRGVLITPQSRTDFAYRSTLALSNLWWAAPLVAVAMVAAVGRRAWSVVAVLAALGLVVAVAILSFDGHEFDIVLVSAMEWAPVVVVGGSLALLVRHASFDSRLVAPLLLLLALAAFMGLAQYPFGAPIYFCYVAPLVVLASVALAAYVRVGSRLACTLLLAAYATFAVVVVDQSLLASWRPDPSTVILDSTRASIRVMPAERDAYTRAASLLDEHGRGRYVFAGPDTPALYFLADRENPTRSLFDFLDDTDSARGDNLLRTLDERGVTAIAINTNPQFSLPLEDETVAALRARYPDHVEVGDFEVRWKAA